MAAPKRHFERIVETIPFWTGPPCTHHVAFHRSGQVGKLREATMALRTVGREWAMGWEGERFVVSFRSEVGGC